MPAAKGPEKARRARVDRANGSPAGVSRPRRAAFFFQKRHFPRNAFFQPRWMGPRKRPVTPGAPRPGGVERTSMCALFSAERLPSARRMKPGEGFLSPAAIEAFGGSSARAFFAGGCR